jgi:hypothetical protein
MCPVDFIRHASATPPVPSHAHDFPVAIAHCVRGGGWPCDSADLELHLIARFLEIERVFDDDEPVEIQAVCLV